MTNIEDNVINLINISKSYYIGKQEVPVLTDINLSIKKGEFVSIMGSSGAGKSTLMKCLFGIYSFDEGEIILDAAVDF